MIIFILKMRNIESIKKREQASLSFFGHNRIKGAISLVLIVLAIIAFCGDYAAAQCSDAGICVIGKKQIDVKRKSTSSVGFSYIFGSSGKDNTLASGETDLTFNTLKLEAELEIFKSSFVSAGIPYSFISGPRGSAKGIGDLVVLWSKSFQLTGMSFLTVQAGGKLATGNVNAGDSLPQSYQPGLGTNDLLVGVMYSYENFFAAGAYQKPFGRSNNKVTRLKRGDDVFVRLGYMQPFERFNVKGEVLVIKRIQESSIINPIGTQENFIDIDGSNPLQVNLQAAVTYFASNQIALNGSAALALLRRDSNLDGLKRNFTAMAGVSYLFRLK